MSVQPDRSPYATYENMSQLNVKPTTAVKEQTWPVLHRTDKIQRPNKTGFPRVTPLHKCHLGKGSLQWEQNTRDLVQGRETVAHPSPKG